MNLIYDTTLGFRIWKGQYLRDENSTPYRVNPWQWNIETAPSPMMWLYFDYYGLHLVSFMSTSESYFNYFSGDPVGQNIYLLPNSNIFSLDIFTGLILLSTIIKLLPRPSILKALITVIIED